jgi:hypothetical protein
MNDDTLRGETPVKILGQDDWLFYARLADGTLVYTVTETDWHWLEAPHGSDCWNESTGLNCDGETKFVCRTDSAYMHEWVTAHAAEYEWYECGTDPVSGEYLGWPESRDEEFTANSRAAYLPREERDGNVRDLPDRHQHR